MSPEPTAPAPRRIAVTLEASATGRPLLETCVRLAALLDAELEGIFIEDINLIRLAGLPFLREQRPASLGEESVSARRMQQELRGLARQAARMLEQAAREMGVPWSFQVWRGAAGVETLCQVFPADVLGLTRVSTRAATRLWATAGTRTRLSGRSLGNICVLFGTSETALRALDTAARLARELQTGLTVLLPGIDVPEDAELRAKAGTVLEKRGQGARIVQLGPDGATALAQAVAATGSGVLVTEVAHPLFEQAGLGPCFTALPCPVLLVR